MWKNRVAALSGIIALILALPTGCVSTEAIERERQWERDGAAACTQVWYSPPGYRGECVSPLEAQRRDARLRAEEQRRWVEEQRKKQMAHEREVACIQAGGTWHPEFDGRCSPGSREIRIVR